ncbi:protein APEM9 isoform X1 [Phoenix dactylifera]|uniref:Protein APEM9 isoform X1 n=1 Tax=Phoenix dactylifera TaxID=42345 RepID=A0A8B7MVX4_PHODC|nr:protein APEM9 isoform X2 [Phoenix dactylifera]XP_017699770.1 protein APEM9 isoform X1 [Phoenix dactylifera]
MAAALSETWKAIDVSESCLVCCMFEEAASLSSSILRQIHTTPSSEAIDDGELAEMMVSAGMVFVQSLREMRRTSELLIELKTLYGSVAAIPVQVFLAWACMQIAEGFSSNLREIFEEFLSKWKYLDGNVYVLTEAESRSSSAGGIRQSIMNAEKYLEVAEVYTITLLGMILHNSDLAISWTERAELPEEKRQDMLRRLHSLHCATESSSSPGPRTINSIEKTGSLSAFDTGSTPSGFENYPKTIRPLSHSNGDKSKADSFKSVHPTIRRISDQIHPCLCWFRTVHLRLGNIHLVLQHGRLMLLGPLIFLTYYILQKKGAVLKRIVAKGASSIRSALIDAWRLAFSVQVNPLAAVQQLPSGSLGNR